MGCFAVPTTAAIVHYFMRKKNPEWKHSAKHKWLNLLWAGGAIFGIIDHLWNGEFFMISPNLFSDLMLGATITFVIFGAWAWIVVLDKSKTIVESKTKEPVPVKVER